MSNIYIQEPPTSGKVLLHTTVGDIDVELWCKEAPKACRNFIQLSLEGYYDGTIFHRVVKGFIVQGGDPEGTGFGGESIYGAPFKNETHSRLRFVRRGLVAMANSGKEDNGSQYFFTLGACPELQNKHTIFGKVTGNTLYNMLKLEESLVDADDRPIYPHKVLSCKILDNPFTDIVPRVLHKDKLDVTEEKVKDKAKKNYSLLSFGEEAEEDEAEADAIVKEFRGKSKSSHDLANDPKLSSVPAVARNDAGSSEVQDKRLLESVRKKLKKGSENKPLEVQSTVEPETSVTTNESEADLKRKEIQKEIKELKRELSKKKHQKETEEEKPDNEGGEVQNDNPLFAEYGSVIKSFTAKKRRIPSKGAARESQTMELFAKFRNRIMAAKETKSSTDEEEKHSGGGEVVDQDIDWLSHDLHWDEEAVIAKDANIPSADRYDITDPRNPMALRRRQAKKKGKDRTLL